MTTNKIKIKNPPICNRLVFETVTKIGIKFCTVTDIDGVCHLYLIPAKILLKSSKILYETDCMSEISIPKFIIEQSLMVSGFTLVPLKGNVYQLQFSTSNNNSENFSVVKDDNTGNYYQISNYSYGTTLITSMTMALDFTMEEYGLQVIYSNSDAGTIIPIFFPGNESGDFVFSSYIIEGQYSLQIVVPLGNEPIPPTGFINFQSMDLTKN